MQTNSLPPVSRAGTTTTTSQSQLISAAMGGSLRMRLLDRTLDQHGQELNTGSAQMLASIGESGTANAGGDKEPYRVSG
jgi:hypothetical protein